MGERSESSDRLSSACVRAATSAICILALVAVGGIVGLGSVSTGEAKSSKAKPPKNTDGPRVSRYAPAPATGAFGIDLLRALQPANVVLSPDSVAAALGMTGMGGVGRTAQEIASTLHLKGPASLAAVGDLQRAIVAGQTAAAAG